jgi:hypothetical protein
MNSATPSNAAQPVRGSRERCRRVRTFSEVHMRHPLFACLATTAIVAGFVFLARVSVATQAASAAPAPPWQPTRTPDGQPDLQGIWTNLTITPLERPASLAGKAVLSDSEAKALEQRAAQNAPAAPAGGAPVGPVYNNFQERADRVVRGNRTSLVIDPPDGRIPALTAAAERRVAAGNASLSAHGAESHMDLSAYIRCLTRGMPHSMLPGGSNSNYEILQVADAVVISMEMIHDVRVIPIDGRPHLPPRVPQWLGDSRGRWEGQTLVVDTTNFPETALAAYTASSLYKWLPQTTLHLTERFTRVDADTIDYQFTVDDPATFERPWTVLQSLRRTKGPLFEYSCHEGNEADVEAILNGARAQERSAAAAKKQSN